MRELALLDAPLVATNIVFMGMGEPLMNWRAVDRVLTILNAADGFGIGARHVTVSTVGVLPGIVALGERPEQFRLALSIHAHNDALRATLMPVNTKYPLAEDVILTRAVSYRFFEVESADQVAGVAGRSYTAGGFLSTSTNSWPPKDFLTEDAVVVQLYVPAGTPAVFVRELSEAPEENEVLLARGRSLTALSAAYDRKRGRWVIRCLVTAESA